MSSLKKTRKKKKRRSTYFFFGRTPKKYNQLHFVCPANPEIGKHKSFPFAVTSTIRMNPHRKSTGILPSP